MGEPGCSRGGVVLDRGSYVVRVGDGVQYRLVYTENMRALRRIFVLLLWQWLGGGGGERESLTRSAFQ